MIKKKNIYNIFYLFLLSHLIIWTLIPSISNVNLPLDTIEALAWGSNLDWGFNKHPPLSAFVVEVFYQIFGNQDWVFYFLSQVFVIITFFIIFKFSSEFFKSEKLAILSVLLLEGIFFYNYTTPEFNVNVCQLPFWALSVYYSWKCVNSENSKDYILLGLVIGLGILSKYLFLYLIISLKLFFVYLINKKIKKLTFNLFIPGFVALIVILPHIFWLFENNYSTITYGLQRTGGVGSFFDHISLPIIFLIKQLTLLIPFLLMSFFLIKKFKYNINFKDTKLVFLLFMTVVPIILVLATSLLLGVKIRTMWMTPFYLFFGMLIIYLSKGNLFNKISSKFLTIFIFFFLLSPMTYLGISLTDNTKRTDYPGKEIARLVQNKWDSNFNNEIKVVVGDEWFAGNLSYHLTSRPKWQQSLKNKASKLNIYDGVVYTGNPKVLKKICPGVFGEIKPVGYCMIGAK